MCSNSDKSIEQNELTLRRHRGGRGAMGGGGGGGGGGEKVFANT